MHNQQQNGPIQKLEDEKNGQEQQQQRNISFFKQLMPQKCAPFKDGFHPKRALIVSKSSLLEYEFEKPKKRYKDFDDPQFLKDLSKKYANIVDLKQRHELQQQYIGAIYRELERHDIEWRVVRRREYSTALVHWSDLIISAGGDGTFLTAAKRVLNGQKPVIGINTDPVGSEGFLCLTGKSRHPADEVIQQFLAESAQSTFHWMNRQRIRVTLLNAGDGNVSASPSSSSIQQQQAGQNDENAGNVGGEGQPEMDEGEQIDDDGSEMSKKSKFSSDDEDEHVTNGGGTNLLNGGQFDGEQPMLLALNEVFIGESHAARVSYYDVQVDNGPMTKQKSSGMTICTGSGSTSWHYNINRITEQTLSEILTVMNQMGLNLDREVNSEMMEEICRRFNDKLNFGPELQTMAFSVRDPVFNATFPKTPIRGFCTKIQLKSRCTNAHLILDGSSSIPFNRGAEVLLEIHPEDALRTAVFATKQRS